MNLGSGADRGLSKERPLGKSDLVCVLGFPSFISFSRC